MRNLKFPENLTNGTHCTQDDFLKALQQAAYFPREFILLALQDITSKVAFFTYVLLLDVALHSDIQLHTIEISQQTIADYLHLSVKTIKRAIRLLKKKGYLNVTPVPPIKGGYQVNQLQVLFPEPLLQTLLHPDKPFGLSLSKKGETRDA